MNGQGKIAIDIVKRIAGTFYIPLIIYYVIKMVAFSNGQTYFGNFNTWRNIILNTGSTATIAYALAVQIKHGRFDFSGGAVMTLGAIIAIFITKGIATHGILFLFISIMVCVLLSFFVANLYVWGRIPVVMCTIGATILFESITLIFNGGKGGNISTEASLNFFGKDMGALIVLTLISAVIYFTYMTFSVSGKQAILLANNQESAVNIGIRERINVVHTFIVSGILYGIAAVVYASQTYSIEAVTSVLSTVGTAFRSILPVFMGFYIGKYSKDTIGIFFSSFAIGTLTYGIEIIAPVDYAGSFKLIVYGFFVIVFFLVSHQGGYIIKQISAKLKMGKKNISVLEKGI